MGTPQPSGSKMSRLYLACLVLSALLAAAWGQEVEYRSLPDSGERQQSAALNSGLYRYTSPNYPFPYPNNANVQYTLTCADGQNITIRCIKIKIQFSFFCSRDYLSINGQRYCGFRLFSPTVTSASLAIQFVSNRFIRRKGFSCLVRCP